MNIDSKILRDCQKIAKDTNKRYDFWIVNDNGQLGFEGGIELPLETEFRNTFSVFPDGHLQQNFN